MKEKADVGGVLHTGTGTATGLGVNWLYMFMGRGTYTGTGTGTRRTLWWTFSFRFTSNNKKEKQFSINGVNYDGMLAEKEVHQVRVLPVCTPVSTVRTAQETPLLCTSGTQSVDLFFSSLETVWTLAWRTNRHQVVVLRQSNRSILIKTVFQASSL